MKTPLIHKKSPAQFDRLALWLAGYGHDVTSATTRENVRSDRRHIMPFATHRAPALVALHRFESIWHG